MDLQEVGCEGELQWGVLQLTNATMNSFYQYHQDATTNADEYYRPAEHTRAHDVSGLPALIRASVVIFIVVYKIQLSV
jgi:hypothetical protein